MTDPEQEFQGVGRNTQKFLIIQVDVQGMSEDEVDNLRTAMTVQSEDTPADGKVESTIQLDRVV